MGIQLKKLDEQTIVTTALLLGAGLAIAALWRPAQLRDEG
jgi:hypothetical protein